MSNEWMGEGPEDLSVVVLTKATKHRADGRLIEVSPRAEIIMMGKALQDMIIPNQKALG